jgi:hypothetical protein
MTDRITGMRQKNKTIRPEPGTQANHRNEVIPELSERFDGIQRRETRQTFDLPIAQLH